MSRSQLGGAGLTLGSMLSVQLGAAVAVSLFRQAGPLGTVAVRVAFGAALLLAATRPAMRRLRGSTLAAVAAFGIATASMNACYYLALDRAPLGVVAALEMVGPLSVAVGGSRRRRDLLVVAVAAMGVLVLAFARGVHGRLTAAGIVLSLAAGCCWAVYILLSAHVGSRLPGVDGLALAMAFAAVPLAVIGALDAGGRLLHAHVLLVGGAVGILSTAVPYSLEMLALRRLRSATFGLVLALAPAIGALVGFAVRDQRLTGAQLAGIALVVAASAAAVARAEPRATAESLAEVAGAP